MKKKLQGVEPTPLGVRGLITLMLVLMALTDFLKIFAIAMIHMFAVLQLQCPLMHAVL
jgi:hypothetical protein